jgi:Flp pilus assembly protein TadD
MDLRCGEQRFRAIENCRTISDTAYKLGREAEEAKSKPRFLIYQNLKLMAQVYGWHGEPDRSVQQAEAAVAMSPYDAELRSSLAGFIANAGKLDEADRMGVMAHAHDEQRNIDGKLNLAWANYLAGRSDEARAIVAEWRKNGPFSIATASCWQIKEPMKSVDLDDLRKAGLPER